MPKQNGSAYIAQIQQQNTQLILQKRNLELLYSVAREMSHVNGINHCLQKLLSVIAQYIPANMLWIYHFKIQSTIETYYPEKLDHHQQALYQEHNQLFTYLYQQVKTQLRPIKVELSTLKNQQLLSLIDPLFVDYLLCFPVYYQGHCIASLQLIWQDQLAENDELIEVIMTAIQHSMTCAERFEEQQAIKNNFKQLKQAYQLFEDSQRKLAISERLASIGQLAAGVAHEINNPIAVVMSNIEVLIDNHEVTNSFIDLLETYFEQNTEVQKTILLKDQYSQLQIIQLLGENNTIYNESLISLKRVKKIVQKLREFAEVDNNAVQKISISQCLEQTVGNFPTQDHEHVSFNLILQPNIYIEGNYIQLSEVFTHLLLNAVQACELKGQIDIACFYEGTTAKILFTDDGCGMTIEELSKIFNPFYTTKAIGNALGMSLAICQRIIQNHHGTIGVSSKQDAGSCFSITLPCTST